MYSVWLRQRKQDLVLIGILLLFNSCALIAPQPEKLSLEKVEFSDLSGWSADTVSEALPSLRSSCKILVKKSSPFPAELRNSKAAWTASCEALAHVPERNEAAARQFLTTWFIPYSVAGHDGYHGLFTGYYEAELRGSLQREGVYQTPLYLKPDDWAEADLGLFKNEWQGQKITGKVVDHKFVPYDSRAEIDRGALKERARVLVWVDDPIGAFFLAIQGSGRIQLASGRELQVGYDSANGHAYTAIGRVMADKNMIEKPVTMQKIRAYLTAHPSEAQNLMDLNASYIFFRELTHEGPVGAEGVVLTPGRSLAVDPAFIPLGVPLWLNTTDGEGRDFHRLMIAEDTGGAIKGAVRGDVFWGHGPLAETEAGAMQSRGRYYILLPKGVLPHEER